VDEINSFAHETFEITHSAQISFMLQHDNSDDLRLKLVPMKRGDGHYGETVANLTSPSL
jgi:hypothetical protein